MSNIHYHFEKLMDWWTHASTPGTLEVPPEDLLKVAVNSLPDVYNMSIPQREDFVLSELIKLKETK